MRAQTTPTTLPGPVIDSVSPVRWGVTSASHRAERLAMLAEAVHEGIYRDSGDAAFREHKRAAIIRWLAALPATMLEQATVHSLIVGWRRDE